MSSKNINRQLLKWSLIGFVLVPTVLVWLVIGSSLFGYRLVSLQGDSMESALHHGDALWAKRVDPAEVKVGDIVTLQHPTLGGITHRVLNVQTLPQEGYILETKGDANCITELSEIDDDETVIVSLMRIRYVGYVLESLSSIGGIVLFIGLTALAIAIYVRREGTLSQ